MEDDTKQLAMQDLAYVHGFHAGRSDAGTDPSVLKSIENMQLEALKAIKSAHKRG